jgi:DNA-binding beta-propeller fold protein YncE
LLARTGPASSPTIAIAPDGKTVYVVSDNAGTVTPISTATNIARVPLVTSFAPRSLRAR